MFRKCEAATAFSQVTNKGLVKFLNRIWGQVTKPVENVKMPNDANDDFVVKSSFISERHACSIFSKCCHAY